VDVLKDVAAACKGANEIAGRDALRCYFTDTVEGLLDLRTFIEIKGRSYKLKEGELSDIKAFGLGG
jgi:hypothetical protein